MAHRILAGLCVLLTAAADPEYLAKVVGVSDGDTLTVLRDDKTQVRIRLNGIDAPEMGQDFGARSNQASSAFVFGQVVTIHPRDTDRYGRTVADVVLPDGTLLNHELVRGGWAWWYRQYAPNDRMLASQEAEARAARRGLWAQPGAVPPWESRKAPAVPHGAAGAVVANRSSKVFHRPTCPAVRKMAQRNRVEFSTAEEAIRSGYRKAGDCR